MNQSFKTYCTVITIYHVLTTHSYLFYVPLRKSETEMDDEHKTTDPFLGKCKINRLTSFKETKDAYTTKHNSFYSIDYCAIKILMASFCHGFALFLFFFQL